VRSRTCRSRVVKRLKSEGISISRVERKPHPALSIADIGHVIETGYILAAPGPAPGPEPLRNEQARAA
jgi:ABC-type branched-subunit amino acid transport system ATPase component